MLRIMGREVVVAVTNGRLDFGTWERIFYNEFDSQSQKRVLVKISREYVPKRFVCCELVLAPGIVPNHVSHMASVAMATLDGGQRR